MCNESDESDKSNVSGNFHSLNVKIIDPFTKEIEV